LGKNLLKVQKPIHAEDRDYLKRCYEQLLKGENKKSIEFRIVPAEGDIRWLCLTGPVLIKEAGNKHILTGLIDDISKVKQNHALLEKFAAKKIRFWKYSPTI
jgi:two-component system sensor histidine kinase VicK